MAARQAPLSLGFSRQEHWSGLPFPSPMHESERWKVKLLSRVRLFTTPWTTAYQAPPSMGFSRQEDWSGMPLSSPILKLFSIKCNYIKRLGIQYIMCSLKPYQYINHDKVTLFFKFPSIFVWASLVVQLVKNPPAMQETLGWILGQEVPLEKG